MDNSSSLPDAWVAKIFQKLTLVYGRDFLNRYEGINIADVMADWAHELRTFQQSPGSIKHGLETLPPGVPPTVLQFRDACFKAPKYVKTALVDYSRADPEVVKAVNGAVKRAAGNDPCAWARRLKARIDAGYKQTIAQRHMVRDALADRVEVLEHD